MPTPSPKVTFWGAAHTVTGSMHLVEANGLRILIDVGLFQGRRAEARERNSSFPFEPSSIDAVLISHAHIDHIGNLPHLVNAGFEGPIFCTPATRDLMSVMLEDAAKIQEEDAAYLNRKRHGEPLIVPLYQRRDVVRTMRLVQSVPYRRKADIQHRIEFEFRDAGHLLGSAMIHLRIPGATGDKTITFTGDLGRRKQPILRDPAQVPAADLLISESTYGGRDHPPIELLADDLLDVIRRTFDRGGKVMVPAFSLGRTQNLLYFLHGLIAEGKLGRIPIFVDSPLAMRATEVYRLHPECYDEETSMLLADDPNLFGHELVRYVRDAEESKALNGRKDSCVVIAASGMCESGRILHHLKHNISDPKNSVLIIGYQAPNTLGRRLVEKRPEVRIHDRMVPLNAEVAVLNGFSSHADRHDFDDFLGPIAGDVGKVRLVHGEADQATALAEVLKRKGFRDIAYPDRGDTTDV